MNQMTRFVVLLAWTWAGIVASAQAQDAATYIVRFKDSAVPQVKPGSVKDDRVAQDPERWGHVGERVVAHVQALEKRHNIQANAAFGTVFKGMSVRLTASQREALRREPSVDVIEQEQVFSIRPLAKPTPGGTGNTTSQVTPWGISKTMATQSYTLAGDGKGQVAGVNAYIIDTGLDTNNTDLNRAWHVNFTGDGRNIDCNGHGTHVAGTVAAYDNSAAVVGMAPGVSLYGVKVLDCQGNGTTTSVINGLDWVAKNALKPAVANMSLGGSVSDLLDTAVRNAAATGIFFAIAAGNSGTDACTSSPARVGGGSTPGVMTVAATDSNDAEAWFSNYGRCVDIWAPGVNITSLKLGGGITNMSGTSMASPHVAGAAALYQGKYATSPANVVSALKVKADSTGTLSKDGVPITRLDANIQ